MEQIKRGRKPKPKGEVIDFPERKPALDPDAREKQMTALAYEAAEKQLREGTASAAVITHFLKLGSKREALEQEILEKQRILIEAKSENIQQGRDSGELAKGAIESITRYRSSSNG